MELADTETIAMHYPIVIHKDADSDYGVTVPDMPGCFTAAPTVDEAIVAATEAAELYLEYLVDEGKPVPRPGSIDEHRNNPDYKGGVWAVVKIDESSLRVRARRLSITVPERALDAIDRYADAHGETRSGLLTRAALEYIGKDSATMPKPVRGRHHRRLKANED